MCLKYVWDKPKVGGARPTLLQSLGEGGSMAPPHSYSTAIDTDECALNNGGCQHKCINTDGSYYCSCDTGYDLQQDKLSCQGTSS